MSAETLERCGSRFFDLPCEREVVATITVGCVGEHVRTRGVCQPCLDRFNTGETPLCLPCGSAHRVVVLSRRTSSPTTSETP